MTDDFDGVIPFDQALHAPALVTTTIPGVFTQAFSVTDSHNAAGTAAQTVYVDKTPVFNAVSECYRSDGI